MNWHPGGPQAPQVESSTRRQQQQLQEDSPLLVLWDKDKKARFCKQEKPFTIWAKLGAGRWGTTAVADI